MTKRIVVHIGGSKCGSSAIQHFLKKNYKDLKKKGFLVPTTNMLASSDLTGEHIWYFENMLADPADHIPRFHSRIDQVMKGQGEKGTLVFSAENLSNPRGFEKLFAGLEDRYKIDVVLYVRRQDDYLMSAWQQWFLKTNPDFWSWCVSQLGQRGNWQQAIQPWVDLFGKDHCTVRLFERDQLVERDINRDFCEAIGCETDNLEFDVGTVNPSFNLAVQQLAESSQQLFDGLHDNKFYEMVGELTGNRHYKRSEEVFLTRFQRHAIIDRYSESNAWVKDTFFADLDRSSLFSEVARRTYENPKRTLEQEKEALVLDLIFQLYERTKKK